MKTKAFLILSMFCFFVLLSCQSNETEIPFKIAKNYFVKNSIENLDNPEIADAEEFERTFGMATIMGEDGRPTSIDFSNEFVIAVVLPETNKDIKLEAKKLTQDKNGNLTFTYSKEEGEELSHTIKPSLIIVANKQHDGKVKIKED